MKRVKKRDTMPPVTPFFFKLCSFFLYLVSLPPGPNLQFWYRAVALRWFCGLAAQTLGYSTSPSSELKAVTQNKTFKKLRNYTAGQRWNIITLPNANTFSGMPDRCSEDRRRLSLTLFVTRLSNGYFWFAVEAGCLKTKGSWQKFWHSPYSTLLKCRDPCKILITLLVTCVHFYITGEIDGHRRVCIQSPLAP